MSKNYLRAVYNLRSVMNDDRYSDDDKRQFIQQARQNVQENGISRSSAYVRAKDNLSGLMHNDNLSDDQKRTYILQAMDRLSQNGNPYDIFKEPEEKHENPYVDRYKVKNPKYNPLMPGINGMPKNEFEYDGQLDKAQKSSNALIRSGIDVPKPDEDEKLEKSNKSGWFMGLLDKMASPFYALNKGLKNVADDDSNTSFFGGVKEGFKAGWSGEKENPNKATAKDVLETLLHSNNDIKKGIGRGINEPIARILRDINVIYKYGEKRENELTPDDFGMQVSDKWHDKAVGATGLALDFLEPNPLGWLKGVGKGANLLTKGSKALKVSDELGGINKAHDVLKTVLPEASRKDAEYLLRKTSKILGGMEDYKGIRLGTEAHNIQAVKPETIAKIGDYTTAPIFNKVRDIMSNTNISETLNNMFTNETKLAIRADKQNGLKHMAQSMADNILENTSSMNKKAHLDKASQMEKEIYKKSKNGKEMSNIMSDAIENQHDIYDSKIIEKTAPNPHYALELNAERAKRYKEAVDQRVELQKLVDTGKGSDILENKIRDLDEEIKHLDSLGDYKNYYQGKDINVPYKDLQSGYYQTKGNNISDSLEGFKDDILDKEPSTYTSQDIKKTVDKIFNKSKDETNGKVTPISSLIEKKKTPIEKLSKDIPLKEVAAEETTDGVLKGQQSFDFSKLLKNDKQNDIAKSESLIDKIDDVDESVVNRLKPDSVMKEQIDKIHMIDKKLGNKPTEFAEGTTSEQLDRVLNNRINSAKKDNKFDDILSSKIFNPNSNENIPNISASQFSINEIEHTIGNPNGMKPIQKQLLNREMAKTKAELPEEFQNIPFTKQFGVMSQNDYANEMTRLREMREVWNNLDGDVAEKSEHFRNYLENTKHEAIQKLRERKDINQNLKVPSIEKIKQVEKIKDEERLFSNDLLKSNKKINKNISAHDIPEDKLEDIMLDRTAPTKENMVEPLKQLERKAYAMKMHDAKWSEDVLKGINEGRYDTTDKVNNALDSINAHFKNIPVSEEKGTKQLFKILNNEDYSSFKQLSKKTGSTDMRIYHYNGTKIAIDKNVPPTKVKALFKTLDEAPIETKRILENTNQVNYINSFLSDNALGRATKDSKNITVTSKVKKSLMQHILNHEVSHINLKDGNDRANLFKMIRNETTRLVPEELKVVEDAIKKAGLEPAQDIKKYLTSHSEKSGKIDEFLADTCALFLNGSPKVREVMSKSMPGTKMAIDKMSQEFPKLSRSLPNNNKYAKLKEQLDYYNSVKNTVKSGDFSALDKKITDLATHRSVEQMEKVLSDFTPREPKEFTQTVNKIVKSGEVIDNRVVEAGLTDLMKSIKKDFAKWGNKEEITQMSNYVTHMLNTDLQYTRKGRKTLKKLQDTGVLTSPKNMFDFQRKHSGTIKEINEVMKKKYGIDNFFETNITKIYLHRAFKHEDVMLNKHRFDNFMNLFSERLDHTRLERMNPAERNLIFSDMKQRIKSGEYTVVQKTENFLKKPGKDKTVIKNINGKDYTKLTSDSAVERMLGDIGYHTDNPFVEVNAKRLKENDLFNGSNDFYLVPTKSLDMYKKSTNQYMKDNSNALLKAYDKFTNMWKAMAVTSGTFHVNNAVGNVFNSYLEIGGDILNPQLNNAARKIQGLTTNGKIKGSFMGKPNSYWAKEAEKYGVIGDGFFSTSANSYIRGKAKKLSHENKLEKLNPLSNNNFIYETNRKAGNIVEQQARLVNFLHHVSKGKTPQEAADLTNKVLFDYSDLTQFEKGTMKRIIPFYTFLRKNAPYQLEQMFNHWDKYGKIKEGIKDVSKPESDDQKKFKPDYVDENYIHLGKNKYKDFNLPSQDLEKLTSPKDMISSLNPLLKLAMELPTNKNIYFDSPIAKDDRDKKEKYRNHILKSLVPLANRTGSIPGAFRGDDKDKKKVIGWLTGFKTEEPDIEKAKKYAKKKYLDKLQEEETYQWKQGKIKPKEKNPLGAW